MLQFQQLRRQQQNGNECCQGAKEEMTFLLPLASILLKTHILSFCESSVFTGN